MPYDRRGQLRQKYVCRINRVLDYVRENLTGDLRLEMLARVANFSPGRNRGTATMFHDIRAYHRVLQTRGASCSADHFGGESAALA